MSFRLIGLLGGHRQVWPLEETPGGVVLEIGRSSRCAISLPDGTVSKSHAELSCQGGVWQVRDLGSRNGTRVNGVPVTGVMTLKSGDSIEFGHVVLELTTEDVLSSTMTPESVSDARSSLRISAQDILTGALPGRAEGKLMKLLTQAGQLLILPRPLRETCEAILEVVERAVPSTRLILLLRQEGSGDLTPIASRQRAKGGSTQPLAISRTILMAVLAENTSVLTSDATEDPRFREQMSIVAQAVHSAMAVPLFDNERVLGILYAESNFPGLSYSQEQLEILTLLANMAAVKITNARLLETEQQRLRMQQELSTAMGIQRGLLPATPPLVAGYNCLARLESCFEVGGDLYDWQINPDGSLWIVQGDVTGKGMGAALLMSSFIASSRVLLETDRAPEAIAAHLNTIMLRSTDPVHFVTAFLGRLEPATGRLVYVNAGHPPPLLLDGRGVTALETTGPPIGMLPNLPFQVAEARLEPGALLAIFSDGIPEARRAVLDEYFEDERVVTALSGLRDRPTLAEIAAGLIDEVDRFLAGEPRSDDITLTLVRRNA